MIGETYKNTCLVPVRNTFDAIVSYLKDLYRVVYNGGLFQGYLWIK